MYSNDDYISGISHDRKSASQHNDSQRDEKEKALIAAITK